MLNRSQITAALDRLPKVEGEFSPRVLEANAGGAFALGQLDEANLALWLERASAGVTGADAKLSGAYLAGYIGWALADLFAGLAMHGAWLTDVDVSAVGLSPRAIHWSYQGQNGTSYAFDVAIDPDGLTFTGTDENYGAALEELFAPFVDKLHTSSGLPRAALWRLMGDSVSGAFLAHGKAAQRVEEAMGIALTVLHNMASRLYAKQAGFDRVHLPERPAIADWFRLRAGCCRYYTAEGGAYCGTCVLRDAASRTEKLRDYLREVHVAGQAAE